MVAMTIPTHPLLPVALAQDDGPWSCLSPFRRHPADLLAPGWPELEAGVVSRGATARAAFVAGDVQAGVERSWAILIGTTRTTGSVRMTEVPRASGGDTTLTLKYNCLSTRTRAR
jgi:hypothetical protein